MVGLMPAFVMPYVTLSASVGTSETLASNRRQFLFYRLQFRVGREPENGANDAKDWERKQWRYSCQGQGRL